MSLATSRAAGPSADPLPSELLELRDRVRSLPPELRAELEPVVSGVLEHARFRDRILTDAREAIERMKLDLELARFDLDATKRERERLRELLEG
jgi:hypothetical protein